MKNTCSFLILLASSSLCLSAAKEMTTDSFQPLPDLSAHETSQQESAAPASQVPLGSTFSSLPLSFTENQGQWPDSILFRAFSGGATMWFTPSGIIHEFTRRIPKTLDSPGLYPIDRSFDDRPGEEFEAIEVLMVKAELIGANRNPTTEGQIAMKYKCNYFLSNDPERWRTDVSNFESIRYNDIYPGIDLKYYGRGKLMEYDFIVSPGADYSQIELRYEGAESVSINPNGQLVVETKWGEVIEQRPVIYQIENNSRISIAGKFRMKSENSFGFELASDCNPALSLVIDPALVYSTYLGGSGDEQNFDITVDSDGSAYVTGLTNSSDFPTVNPYQGSKQADRDVFITKFSSTGNSPVYSTFFGGSSTDIGDGIAVDTTGAAYVAGRTGSTDFPTQNPFQGTMGGVFDAFVIKLSSAGDSLIYSTYLGGTVEDFTTGVAVDLSGAAYVTGYTKSANYPTMNPYQTVQGETDVFVTKLSSMGNSLIYSTYIGGSGFEQPWGGIAVDALGSAYVTGVTSDDDFPTLNAFQGVLNGPNDAFLFKLSSAGNSLIYSTYLGGSSFESGDAVAVDNSGSAYVTGSTNSPTDFPTLNPFQGVHQGSNEIFFCKFSSAGNNLIYSTFFGGTGSDIVRGIAVDSSGSAYLTGRTSSIDFPTLNPYQETNNGGGDDVFVTKFSNTGDGLVYSTYLGGSSHDLAYGIAVDGLGAAYVSGHTTSTDFPTFNAYQSTYIGAAPDCFVAKLEECCIGNRGDVNGDGDDANILDLTFLVDFIFRGSGDPGACPEEADANGDGDSSNILDLTYLVDYIFRGGPAPGSC